MIDLHSHILPALDDGAASMEDSLLLLRQYEKQQVTDVICTPHIEAGHLAVSGRLETRITQQETALRQLREAAAREAINIRLHSGSEFVLTTDLPEHLHSLEKPGLAGSDYLLVELPQSFSGGIRLLDNLLFAIQMAGFMPILAHPERSMHGEGVAAIFADWVQKERLLLQINASSLVSLQGWPPERLDRFAKRKNYVRFLLEERLAFCVASDAHCPAKRPVLMVQARREVAQITDEAYARELFETNPRIVLENMPLELIWQGEGSFI